MKQAEKYVQQGKFALAIDEYRKLLDAAPHDVTLLNTVGDLSVRAGRPGDAVSCFLRVADSYESSGATQSAIAVYKKILKLDADNGDISVKLAALYCKQGLMSDARRQYTHAIEACRRAGEAQKALEIQQRVADIDPENVELRLDLAEHYRQASYVREAYQGFVQAGQELRRKGRLAESADAFKKALELRPDSKVAVSELVELYVQQGDADAALAQLDGMLAAAPDEPDLISMLGRVQIGAGRLDEAEETFARLAEVDPAHPDAPLEVARHHVEAGSYDRAMAIVDRTVDVLVARGLKKRATALLKEILRRDSTNVEALDRLADIYTRVGERRNLTATLNSLVEVATRRGLKAEATAALHRLVELEREAAPASGVADEEERTTARLPRDPAFPPGFEPAPGDRTRGARAAAAGPRDELLRDSLVPDRYDRPEYEVPPPAAEAGAASDYSMELAAELTASHDEFRPARVKLLEELVAGQPRYVAGRVNLKNLYRELGMAAEAAAQCVALARLHEEHGDTELARASFAEAYELQPSIEALSAQVAAAPPRQSEEPFNMEEMFTLQEFNKYFDREWRRAIRDSKPIAVLKIEIDALNDYVDTYGVLGGEYCVERLAAALERELLRPGDLISHCGGGVFLVLLPETPYESAPLVAARMRARVDGMKIKHEGALASDVVTISVGVAGAVPDASLSSDMLIAVADDALVQAKLGGGNAFVAAPLITP